MAARCGAVATLDKPFTFNELRLAVEALLPAIPVSQAVQR